MRCRALRALVSLTSSLEHDFSVFRSPPAADLAGTSRSLDHGLRGIAPCEVGDRPRLADFWTRIGASSNEVPPAASPCERGAQGRLGLTLAQTADIRTETRRRAGACGHRPFREKRTDLLAVVTVGGPSRACQAHGLSVCGVQEEPAGEDMNRIPLCRRRGVDDVDDRDDAHLVRSLEIADAQQNAQRAIAEAPATTCRRVSHAGEVNSGRRQSVLTSPSTTRKYPGSVADDPGFLFAGVAHCQSDLT